MRSLLTASAAAAALLCAPAFGQDAETDAAIGSDYSVDSNWLCLPNRDDACAVDLSTTIISADGSTEIEAFAADPDAPVDCFYVYPTVSNDPYTMSDLEAGPEELSVARVQFARFGAACRTFAPMYRQLTLPALRARFGGEAPEERGTAEDAAADVDAAFAYYLEHYNEGRGIVLVGHSQGSGHISRMVSEHFDGGALSDQLVSAIILGPPGGIPSDAYETVPTCEATDQTGCVISYATFHEGLPPSDTSFFAVGSGDAPAICTNPAALAGGEAEPRAYFTDAEPYNLATGAPEPWLEDVEITTPFVAVPGLITTECVTEGPRTFLQVRVHADPDDPRADDIGGFVLGPDPDPGWGLHLVDANVGIGDLVEIVQAQAETWTAAQE
ncbi:MAG: DUF3089 domain-containing protein [Maricaulaceae bacterium]|jgi:hypothetical protein